MPDTPAPIAAHAKCLKIYPVNGDTETVGFEITAREATVLIMRLAAAALRWRRFRVTAFRGQKCIWVVGLDGERLDAAASFA